MGKKTTKLPKQIHKQTMLYILFGGMGHHALAGRSTSLSLGNGGAMAQWENEWMRGECGWLERQRVSRNTKEE